MGGCLPCWRYTVLNGGLLLRGWSSSRGHCYRHKHQQRGPTNKVQCSSTWCSCPWCDGIVCGTFNLNEVYCIFKCKFKLHMLVTLAKLQMPLFVFHNPCVHVFEVPLKFKCLWLHCHGSNQNSIWIKFDLILFKPNSKSYWSSFKINSNINESGIFG